MVRRKPHKPPSVKSAARKDSNKNGGQLWTVVIAVVVAVAAVGAAVVWSMGSAAADAKAARDGAKHLTTVHQPLPDKEVLTLEDLGLPDVDTVHKPAGMGDAEFIRHLAATQFDPVRVSGLDFPAEFKAFEWTPEYLAETVPVIRDVLANSTTQHHFFYVDNLNSMLQQVEDITWTQPYQVLPEVAMSEFVDSTTAPGHEMYCSRQMRNLGNAQIAEDIKAFTDTLSADVREKATMWISSSRVTAHLHGDISNNLFVQVRGRKRFVMVSTRKWRDVYMFSRLHPATRQSQVDPEAYNRTRFPRFARALDEAWSVLLEPGDILWVPGYTFHHVQTLEAALSVNAFVDSDIKDKVRAANNAAPLPFDVADPLEKQLTIWIWLSMVIDGAPLPAFAWASPSAPRNLNRIVDRGRQFVGEVVATRFSHLDVDPMLHGAHEAMHAGAHTGTLCGPRNARANYLMAAGAGLKPMLDSAQVVSDAFAQLPPGVQGIFLADYVENILDHFVGTPDVLRFMRECWIRPMH